MDANEIWAEVIAELKGQMVKETFDRCIRPAKAVSFDGDKLVIAARDPYSRQWLENRLGTLVGRTVLGIVGAAVQIVYIDPDQTAASYLEPAPSISTSSAESKSDDLPDQLDVHGVYADRRAEKLKPDQIVPVTQYFRKHWVGRLGPLLSWIVVDLRQRAYFNKRTRERRDHFFATLDDIAKAVGVTNDTVWRQLKRECHECEITHPVIEHFVLSREPKYEMRSGKLICIGTSWRVRLDDPLTPEDERALCGAPKPQKRG